MRFAGATGIMGFVVAAVLASPHVGARENGAPARALGMGDAVRAMGMGTSGLYFNPAAMAQTMSYAIDLGYGYKTRSWTAGHNGHVSFVDSKTNPDVAGGAGYAYSYAAKKGDSPKLQTHDIRFAVASQLRRGNIQFCYGGGFRYLNVKQDSVSAGVRLDKWSPTMDLGVLLGVSDTFYIGVAAQNIISLQKTWNPGGATHRNEVPIAPRTVGIGVGVSYSILHFGVDVDIDLESRGKNVATVSPMAGLELTLAQMIALRAGFTWDRVGNPLHDQKRVTGGLGYISKYVGVDAGFGVDVTHSSEWMVESSIRVFLP